MDSGVRGPIESYCDRHHRASRSCGQNARMRVARLGCGIVIGTMMSPLNRSTNYASMKGPLSLTPTRLVIRGMMSSCHASVIPPYVFGCLGFVGR